MAERPDPREADPLFEDEITEEEDGTFSVRFETWHDEALTGIPTREFARRILRFAHEAMQTYGDYCGSDY